MYFIKEVFPINKMSLFIMCIFSGFTFADGVHFDTSMIDTDSGTVADLSVFEKNGNQLPGEYLVDIYLNGKFISQRKIAFQSRESVVGKGNTPSDSHDQTGLAACIDKSLLEEGGVNISQFPSLMSLPAGQCVIPEKVIPQAFTDFDFGQMRLNISVPQASMQLQFHNWVAPERWDDGINATFLNYLFSGSNNYGRLGGSRSDYLNLTTGINIGGWRLRDNSTWSDSESRYGSQSRWAHLSTYAQKAIIPLRSELTIGDSSTENDIFDSVSFRGARMATEDSMYPDNMRGYAPEIKGMAYSNARVSVRQNGAEVYRTSVSPGPFVIKDLYPMTSGGDLEVSVTEADGVIRTYTIPYSSVPLLQRQGSLRYTLTAGQFRSTSSRFTSPRFLQATARLGLPFDITTYGGTQLASNYIALAVGAGVNMGSLGAVSADLTHARSTLSNGKIYLGESVRLLYARSLAVTHTTLQIAGYRYSTKGFHTLEETALRRMSGWLYDTDTLDPTGKTVKQNWINYYDLHNSRKDRFQVNLTQRLGTYGSLFITGSSQRYWQSSEKTRMWQIGFNSNWGESSYSISYSYNHVGMQPGADKVTFLTVSLPLDMFMHHGTSSNAVWAIASTTTGDTGNTYQAGLAGTALENNNFDWDVSQGESHSGSANVAYRGAYGSASAGYSYNRDYRQLRYGAAGGALLHANGLTLGQHLGETNVLIAAPGAASVPLENGSGVRTDWRGYAVMPYASIYRKNRVALDVNQLDDHTDIDNAVRQVVPTRGAIVLARFSTHTGARVMMTLTHAGKPLPFGSTVTADGRSTIVGEQGEVYFSGLNQRGVMNAKWGKGSEQQCSVHYALSEHDMRAPLVRVSQACE